MRPGWNLEDASVCVLESTFSRLAPTTTPRTAFPAPHPAAAFVSEAPAGRPHTRRPDQLKALSARRRSQRLCDPSGFSHRFQPSAASFWTNDGQKNQSSPAVGNLLPWCLKAPRACKHGGAPSPSHERAEAASSVN